MQQRKTGSTKNYEKQDTHFFNQDIYGRPIFCFDFFTTETQRAQRKDFFRKRKLCVLCASVVKEKGHPFFQPRYLWEEIKDTHFYLLTFILFNEELECGCNNEKQETKNRTPIFFNQDIYGCPIFFLFSIFFSPCKPTISTGAPTPGT